MKQRIISGAVIVLFAAAIVLFNQSFPVALNIQDVTLSAPTDAVDWIKVYNPVSGKYEKASYFDEIYESLEAEEPMGSGWGDEDGTVVNMTVNPGQGFWMKTDKDCTVSFKAPKM